MTERRANPAVRVRLLEGAARVLAEEGPSALTLRRVATEADTSTMAVYTHFGSMPDLADAVVAEGFARLAALLVEVPATDDAITDLASLGRAYLVHARQNPNLYAVMFGTASLGSYRPQTASERERGRYTFDEIVAAARRAVDQGRLRAADPLEIAGQLWTAMHGYVMLEVGGYFGDDGVERVLVPMFASLLHGLGADRDAALASIRTLATAGAVTRRPRSRRP
ncbi:TetR/AcrR family transcriptional regulator [Couchioplanes azureus]|uniref:TetR/AcrR family transcriptional regulator n=1 Tax=Couchioplanes caeruleus TaxID=56438 RepID=UPI001670633C|nr:TetR/AcrR family transcriptional regulator [Couchioplanes caeruleus]GGQ81993.1 TetR family transcriptional regulator [Couchioplanes caeruleus subsp. azureus]